MTVRYNDTLQTYPDLQAKHQVTRSNLEIVRQDNRYLESSGKKHLDTCSKKAADLQKKYQVTVNNLDGTRSDYDDLRLSVTEYIDTYKKEIVSKEDALSHLKEAYRYLHHKSLKMELKNMKLTESVDTASHQERETRQALLDLRRNYNTLRASRANDVTVHEEYTATQ
ncbi:hypothetical protein MMC34_001603 [Xylographa carneopallida]|nr:hypothetical protein [Xylographa carneopallida]